MSTTTINIRISKRLKTDFEKAVLADGLDTSTAIRVMMAEYTKGKFMIGIKKKFDQEIAKEIAQGERDYKNGKFITAKTNKEIDSILK
jgi:antitoxin component of RelBE/YafQ-DinJ toxin-antitoxin module